MKKEVLKLLEKFENKSLNYNETASQILNLFGVINSFCVHKWIWDFNNQGRSVIICKYCRIKKPTDL